MTRQGLFVLEGRPALLARVGGAAAGVQVLVDRQVVLPGEALEAVVASVPVVRLNLNSKI